MIAASLLYVLAGVLALAFPLSTLAFGVILGIQGERKKVVVYLQSVEGGARRCGVPELSRQRLAEHLCDANQSPRPSRMGYVVARGPEGRAEVNEPCLCGRPATHILLTAGSEPKNTCGDCADRAPFWTVVRPIPGVIRRGPKRAAVMPGLGRIVALPSKRAPADNASDNAEDNGRQRADVVGRPPR